MCKQMYSASARGSIFRSWSGDPRLVGRYVAGLSGSSPVEPLSGSSTAIVPGELGVGLR